MNGELPNVQVDQVWEDNDPRIGTSGFTGRRMVRILAIEHDYAKVSNVNTGRTSRIKLERFKPTTTGYRLVEGKV